MPELAFLNGEIFPIEEARVSVNDRGFQFGDGVYEVLRSYSGKLWLLQEHLQRLKRSLKAVSIKLDPGWLKKRIEAVFEKSGLDNALVYCQITRGVQPREHFWARRTTWRQSRLSIPRA